jgi:hypothetical protein
MGLKLTSGGIVTGEPVEVQHILQLIDALSGSVAYDLAPSGSFNYTGSIIALNGGFTGSFSGSAVGLQGGVTNYIPLWSSTETQTTSSAYQSSSFFIIGTTTVVSSSASDIFLVKNQSNRAIFTVKQIGIINVATQSLALTGSTNAGDIYFTSNAFYVGLD